MARTAVATLDDDFDEESLVRLPAPKTGMGVPNPENPADIGFPAMLPFEIAMGNYPLSEICGAYEITRAQLAVLLENPVFVKALQSAKELVAKEGNSFKVKAMLQAETIIDTAYKMAHNVAIPPVVRADLIKSIVRWAGHEPKTNEKAGNQAQAFQININL